MKRFLAVLLMAMSLVAAPAKKPKLVVMIVLDQFRYDYITRFRAEYRGGFETLLSRGAVFSEARYWHVPTVTAVGHSTVLTGAFPADSGIVANEWFDRDANKRVGSVSDDAAKMLGGTPNANGASPRRMLVDTVGDEIKQVNPGKSKVIGISLKDRAAILPAGHLADGAYWFDAKTGNFVSSTYYFADLPDWVKQYNASRPADKYKGAVWLNHKLPEDLLKLYDEVDTSPFANEMLEEMAERALTNEQLGKHDATDVLTISYSVHDYVGHQVGPFSPEEREVSLRADQLLRNLFAAIDRQVGLANTIVALTGDHGVAPVPDPKTKMPGGRIASASLTDAIQKALVKAHGDARWVTSTADLQIYLNLDAAAQKNVDPATLRGEAAAALARVPHIASVFTRDQIMAGSMPPVPVAQRVSNGYNRRRGADLIYVVEPYWMLSSTGTTHSTPYSYDTHVPVIFMGPGVRPGRYNGAVMVNDIAPTLANMLDIETPAGSSGRVLTEMLLPPAPPAPMPPVMSPRPGSRR